MAAQLGWSDSVFGVSRLHPRAIYTTNAIESIRRSFRKVTRDRGAFPNDDAVFKLLCPALGNMEKKWTKPIREWTMALNQFGIVFGDRMPERL